jgi:DNA-binding CsgD family transcriptional regulator
VSLLAWVRIVGGDVAFISNETVEALTIAREAGDDASQARCLYGLAAASTGESELFEAVYELGAAAGNVRFRNYGALLALFSVVGTEHAERLFQRAASVGADFDDETFLFLLPGMLAIHCSLRGDQARAAALFREALEHESRAIAAVFNIVGCAMFSALQGSDAELLRLASAYIGPDLRDLPGAEWWVQLLDDAERWALQVPTTWSAAHADAALARACVAVQAADERATEKIHSALSEIVELGLRPLTTEAIELLAFQWTESGHYADAGRLLGAAAGAREQMGLRWRFPHQQRIVDEALERTRTALGDEAFEAAYSEGATAGLDDTVGWQQRMRGGRGRPRRGWGALTPTEIAVAREVAAGRTNAEVADNLFVAISTVKTHLEQIYAKLGIRSRAALATETSQHPG